MTQVQASRPRVVYRGCGDGPNRYEWMTPGQPTRDEVAEAQTFLGFAVPGYGPPSSIKHEWSEPERAWLTTWESASSCD